MEKEKALNFINNSFLSPFLKDDITDISYNGESLYYVSNIFGRKKAGIKVSNSDANDFIRQIANYTEKSFSLLSPILDVSIEKYRINAVHHSIARYYHDEVTTFSIRIASDILRLNKDSFSKEILELFLYLLRVRESIVISGLTGSGKTELQKFLLSLLKENERIILIDNNIELENVRNFSNADITTWQYDENISNFSLSILIKNALRNNPDWIVIAESRGEEMNEIITSRMSGAPIIVTIHSESAFMSKERMASLSLLSDSKKDYKEISNDINEHFRYFIHLKKSFNKQNNVIRYISSIVENDGGILNEIYHYDINEIIYKKSKLIQDSNIDIKKEYPSLYKAFLREQK